MKGKTVPLWSKIAKYVAISISLIGILIIVVAIIGALPATPEQPQPPTLENCQDVRECLALKIPPRSITNAGVFGTITEVIDGDTIRHSAAGTIRLALVNSPERGEPGYQEAKDFTSAVCPVGQKAQVGHDDFQGPTYGRGVGIVYCGGFLLNEVLLTEGHAEISTYFCDKSEYGNTDWARAYGC